VSARDSRMSDGIRANIDVDSHGKIVVALLLVDTAIGRMMVAANRYPATLAQLAYDGATPRKTSAAKLIVL
jgi:hypothetical protein